MYLSYFSNIAVSSLLIYSLFKILSKIHGLGDSHQWHYPPPQVPLYRLTWQPNFGRPHLVNCRYGRWGGERKSDGRNRADAPHLADSTKLRVSATVPRLFMYRDRIIWEYSMIRETAWKGKLTLMTDKPRYIFECIQSKAHELNLYTKSSTFLKVMDVSFPGSDPLERARGGTNHSRHKTLRANFINSDSWEREPRAGLHQSPILASIRASFPSPKRESIWPAVWP